VNNVTSNDSVSLVDSVDENLSDVQSSDSDNEIGDNQEFDSNGQVAPVVSGWHNVKWQMKIWLLGAPPMS
jgi:hypothetical protein